MGLDVHIFAIKDADPAQKTYSAADKDRFIELYYARSAWGFVKFAPNNVAVPMTEDLVYRITEAHLLSFDEAFLLFLFMQMRGVTVFLQCDW